MDTRVIPYAEKWDGEVDGMSLDLAGYLSAVRRINLEYLKKASCQVETKYSTREGKIHVNVRVFGDESNVLDNIVKCFSTILQEEKERSNHVI